MSSRQYAILLARLVHAAIKGVSILGIFIAVEYSDAYFQDGLQ